MTLTYTNTDIVATATAATTTAATATTTTIISSSSISMRSGTANISPQSTRVILAARCYQLAVDACNKYNRYNIMSVITS